MGTPEMGESTREHVMAASTRGARVVAEPPGGHRASGDKYDGSGDSGAEGRAGRSSSENAESGSSSDHNGLVSAMKPTLSSADLPY